MTIRVLLDANLSAKTGQFLEERFGFDVVALITSTQRSLPDHDVVALAKQEQRVIISFDQDFGEIYHFRERGRVGIIVLHLLDQTVESVNRVLERFFIDEGETIDLLHSLVIVEEDRIRVISGE